MPEFKYCPECGHLLPGASSRCTHCGAAAGPRGAADVRRRRIILLAVAFDVVVTVAVVALLLVLR